MAAPEAGTVYLIGAGPGDPELITVKGRHLLQSCDVVLYDNLVPGELVVTLAAEVDKYYVGKRAGKASYSQDEINQLLVKLAREGKNVARLKGSDPLIFGRGSEEAKYLKKKGIHFEIIPGVTSGIAAPAYAGIPCTDRDMASFVLFATGHKAMEKQISSVPWEWVAKAKGGTLVLYMGVAEIGNIVAKLIGSGMSSDMPAAVIERGTFSTQRVFSSTLQRLPETVKTHRVRAPAIFVLGEVVNLRPLIRWFEDKPLLSVRVMVTRPADQAQEMYAVLRSLGAEVLAYPTIATTDNDDSRGWQAYDKIGVKEKWLVFTSENGVRYFLKQFVIRVGDIRKLSGFKIAAIGDGTARTLARFNLVPDFLPTKATTAALAEQLAASRSWEGAAVVRVRGELSFDNIEKSLAAAGADVIPMTVYRTFFPSWPEDFREKLFECPPDVVTFTSGTSVEGLCGNLTAEEVRRLLDGTMLLTIGPSTSKVVREHGLSVSLEAKEHSIPAMIDELVRHFERFPLGRSK